MKLKDIFPRWLFRERSYGELELGGSLPIRPKNSFPGDTGLIFDDTDQDGFTVGVVDATSSTLFPGSLEMRQSPSGEAGFFYAGLGIGIAGESGNRITIDSGGTTLWGSGEGGPDIRQRRLTNESGAYLDISPQGGADGVGVQLFGYGAVYVSDGPSWAGLDTGGTLVLHSPTGNEAGLTPNAANHLQMAGTTALAVLAHGGGVAVTSPDGTKSKLIGIDNAGALVLTDL